MKNHDEILSIVSFGFLNLSTLLMLFLANPNLFLLIKLKTYLKIAMASFLTIPSNISKTLCLPSLPFLEFFSILHQRQTSTKLNSDCSLIFNGVPEVLATSIFGIFLIWIFQFLITSKNPIQSKTELSNFSNQAQQVKKNKIPENWFEKWKKRFQREIKAKLIKEIIVGTLLQAWLYNTYLSKFSNRTYDILTLISLYSTHFLTILLVSSVGLVLLCQLVKEQIFKKERSKTFYKITRKEYEEKIKEKINLRSPIYYNRNNKKLVSISEKNSDLEFSLFSTPNAISRSERLEKKNVNLKIPTNYLKKPIGDLDELKLGPGLQKTVNEYHLPGKCPKKFDKPIKLPKLVNIILLIDFYFLGISIEKENQKIRTGWVSHILKAFFFLSDVFLLYLLHFIELKKKLLYMIGFFLLTEFSFKIMYNLKRKEKNSNRKFIAKVLGSLYCTALTIGSIIILAIPQLDDQKIPIFIFFTISIGILLIGTFITFYYKYLKRKKKEEVKLDSELKEKEGEATDSQKQKSESLKVEKVNISNVDQLERDSDECLSADGVKNKMPDSKHILRRQAFIE